jgi:hypothetical protein
MLASDWITGTIGLSAYFGLGKMKVTQKMYLDSLQADKIIAKRAKAWVAAKRPGKLPKAEIGTKDYDSLVAALDNPFDANPDISVLPEDLQLDVIARYLDVRGWLEQHQPAIKMSGGLIAREIPPPESDKLKFMWSANMINDVTQIFDMLDAGSLTLFEASALREIFPDFTMAVLLAYINATLDFVYNEDKITLSGWQTLGLSTLAGVPITSFDDVLQWQSGFPQPDGPGRPPGDKAPNLAQPNLSDSQRLDSPA